MTTDKKNRLTEGFKSLRDKVAGLMQAAEEETPSAADDVLPEEPAAAVPKPEAEASDRDRRASEVEIAAALRRFTWDSVKPAAEQQETIKTSGLPTGASETLSEETAEELGGASAEDLSEEPLEELLEELHQEIDAEGTGEWPEDREEEPSDASRDEPINELLRELHEEPGDEVSDVPTDEAVNEVPAQNEEEAPAAFPRELLLGIAAGLRNGEANESAEQPQIDVEPAAEENAEAEPADEITDGQTGGFAGFAELLARLKEESEERFNAWEQSVRESGDDNSAAADESDEPDPADVARLWESHSAEEDRNSAEKHELTVDPEKEETHVFTEEDLKSIPRDRDSDETTDDLLADEEQEVQGYTPRDFRPIRRRRYYRSGLVGGIMYFLFVVCVSVALAAFAWLAADDMLSLNKEYVEAEVYVGEDMDVSQIATELHTKGLIRYRRLFALFGKFFHAEDKIEPGTYTLSTKLDYRALIQNMHHYTGWTGEAMATVKVTIPEGKTVMETFQILADHGVCPYETLMECAATETFDYSFLADIPDGDATRLEGYLFPDTYEFYADSSPKAAICRFLDNFEQRIPERVSEQAAANGHTLREILIVASLIEKEAGGDTERATIASVIYNRLQSSSYQYLQIDATIQYAMGEHKEHLTYDDLQVDSPYNTYLYPGLPPGPICNPGLASVRAALSPESTGYYFYALNKNGKHNFFSSYNAFQQFINSSDFGG